MLNGRNSFFKHLYRLRDTSWYIPELGCERSPALTRGVLEYGWGGILFGYCVRGYSGRIGNTSLPIKCPLGIAVAIAENTN